MSDSEAPAADRSSPSVGAGRAFLWSSGARLARALGRLLPLLLAGRFFPLDEVASFATALAVGSGVALLADLGLTEHAPRVVAGSTQPVEQRLALVKWMLLPFAFLAGVVALNLIGAGPGAGGVLVYCLASSVSELAAALRRARGRWDLEWADVAIPQLAGLLAAALAAAASASFATCQWALGGAALAAATFRLPLKWAGAPPGPALWRPLMESRWMLLRAMLAWALIDGCLLVVQVAGTTRDVALFAAAMRPIGLMTQPFVVLQLVFLPALVAARRLDPGSFVPLALRVNQIGLLGLPAVVGASVLGGRLLLAAMGDEYREAVAALELLALAHALHLAVASIMPLLALGHEVWAAAGLAVGAVLLGVAGPVLVEQHGAVGAAGATLVALLGSKATHLLAYRRFGLPFGGAATGAALLVVLAWGGGLQLLPAGVARDLLTLAGAAVSFAAAWRQLRATRLQLSSPVTRVPE